MTRVLDLPWDTAPTFADPGGCRRGHVWLAVRDRSGVAIAAVCRDCDSTYWPDDVGYWPDAISDAVCDAAASKERDDVRS